MPLENACENYTGKILFALPGEWTGWCRFDIGSSPNEPGKPSALPQPFHFRLLELQRFHGDIRAGVGIIEETNHSEDKNWVAFVIRDGAGTNIHNFTTNPANYNLSISKTKPIIRIEPDVLPMPQWMQFEDSSYISGIGYIAETEISLQDIYERIKKVRK